MASGNAQTMASGEARTAANPAAPEADADASRLAESAPTAARPREPEFVEALARGLNVLNVFADPQQTARRGRMTLSDVAKRTGLSRGTARRLLLTLRALNYLESDGKLFWLTPKVLNFAQGYLAPLGLGDAANAVLKGLTETLNESSSVAVLDGADAVYVARVEVRRIYSSRIDIGTRLPAYCSALGRVLLAHQDDGAIEQWLAQHELKAFTPKTVTDPAALRRILAEVREEGFAVVDEELELGIRSIAVPIVGRSGQTHGALNASSSSARVSVKSLERRFLPHIRAAADKLALTMDW